MHGMNLKPIYFLGDSITAAWPLDRYIANAHNAGVDGNETSQMYARLSADVSQHQPWATVILGGTNDVEFYSTPSTTYIEQIATNQRGNDIQCVLCTIPPVEQNSNRPNTTLAKVKAWNAAIVTWARENRFPFVDYYNAMLLPDGTPDWSLFKVASYGYEAHPNNRGYDVMFRAWCPVLEFLVR